MNQLNAESVVALHGYMHKDVYDTYHLRVIDDSPLITESVIDDVLLQAMLHTEHSLIQFFGVIKFCLVYSLSHFKSNIVVSQD